MYASPRITIELPWSHHERAKGAQEYSRRNAGVTLGGSTRGLRVTASPGEFLRMGLARVDSGSTLPLIARLREAGFPLRGVRSIRLPGARTALEVRLAGDGRLARRLASHLAGRADLVTVYDRSGRGHSRAREGVPVLAPVIPADPPPPVDRRARLLAGRRVAVAKHEALVRAIREVWEGKAEEFASPADPDDSDYENRTTQDIVAGYLPQYLTDDQLEQWGRLEPEMQSALLDAAFPEDAVTDAARRLERHYWNQTRGASVSPIRTTVEVRVNPLDLGVGRKTPLARMAGGGTIQDLFT